jgi:AcrR family transcriptional regulator
MTRRPALARRRATLASTASKSVVPTTTKGHRTVKTILEAARQVFGRDGYAEARMTDIAAAAGLSTGGLYRYFLSKESVFDAVIADVHDALFRASGRTNSDFATAPYEALYEANLGYLRQYYAHRDLMRCFREATGVDARFRAYWWQMRKRHVDRFVAALSRHPGVAVMHGSDVTVMADAMACMVEECGYVWYAHESLGAQRVDVERAARVVARIWYQTFFLCEPGVSTPEAP